MDILKLSKVEKIRRCKIEFDYYVPFSISIEGYLNFAKEDNVYWRTGDINKSLIEIGIGSDTGILKSITLVTAKNIKLETATINVDSVIEGIPVFDSSIIPEKGVYDYINDFIVFLNSNSITVVISDIDKCRKIINFDRIGLGIDIDNNITHLSINNLAASEYMELRNAFKFY